MDATDLSEILKASSEDRKDAYREVLARLLQMARFIDDIPGGNNPIEYAARSCAAELGIDL